MPTPWGQIIYLCTASRSIAGQRFLKHSLVLISHEGVDRRDVLDVLSRRWPDAVLKDLAQEEPTWVMTPDDAVDLGTRRRGVELLRIMVMPQKTCAPLSHLRLRPLSQCPC